MGGRKGGRREFEVLSRRGRGRGGRGGAPPARRAPNMKHPDIKLKLTYKTKGFPITAPVNATFGDLKLLASKQTGLPVEGINLLYRGRKKADNEVLSLAGVKNGAEIKVMETDGYRQQKVAQQQEESTFLDFSEAEAAAAREAAARAAAGPTSAPQPAQGGAPPRERALDKIQAIQQQVDALEKEAEAVEEGPSEGPSRRLAGLLEMLTQKLLALDNVDVEGDPEARQRRKSEIVRVNQLCDRLESRRTQQQ